MQQRGCQPHVLPRRQHADQHVAQAPAAVQQLRHNPPRGDRLMRDVDLAGSTVIAVMQQTHLRKDAVTQLVFSNCEHVCWVLQEHFDRGDKGSGKIPRN